MIEFSDIILYTCKYDLRRINLEVKKKGFLQYQGCLSRGATRPRQDVSNFEEREKVLCVVCFNF